MRMRMRMCMCMLYMCMLYMCMYKHVYNMYMHMYAHAQWYMCSRPCAMRQGSTHVDVYV